MTDRRYPLQPLLDAARLTMTELRAHQPMNGAEYRRVRTQGLSCAQADRWAVKLGLTPWEVWPDWPDALDRRRQVARDSARKRYHEDPAVRAKRIASAAAWRAANQRTLKHHPSRQPAARKVQSRAYYVRNAERIKAAARARHAAKKAAA